MLLRGENKSAIFILPSARLLEKGATDKSGFSRPAPFYLSSLKTVENRSFLARISMRR